MEHIIELISRGELDRSIQELLTMPEAESQYKDVLLISARHHDLERRNRLGTINLETFYVERNKIVSSLLGLIGMIEELYPSESVRNPSSGPVKGLALVIGCASYEYGGELANPINDAKGIASRLKACGSWTVVEKHDLDLRDMRIIIDDFIDELSKYDTGLFFFAGHGVQVNGTNYLIPVDARLRSQKSVEYDCVKLGRVLAQMESSNDKTNLIFLDACRNNPFERSWGRGFNGSGLAAVKAPTGSFIAYATAPGKVASDGKGSNSPFTKAFMEHFSSGHSINRFLQEIRKDVIAVTGGDQVPWDSSSLTADFYFQCG